MCVIIVRRGVEHGARYFMDDADLLLTILALLYVGVTIYLANQDELARLTGGGDDLVARQRALLQRWLLYGLALMNFVYNFLILQMALLNGVSDALPADLMAELPAIDVRAALVNAALAGLISWFGARVVASPETRRLIRERLGSGYDPDSPVHTAAVVLCLMFLSATFGQLVLGGGLSGLAQSFDDISSSSLVFQAVLMVVAALLGVGLAIRRTLPQALERLGLRLPTGQDLRWGIGAGLLLVLALMVMSNIWALLAPIEQINEQSAAAEGLSRAFGTLPLAFLLAATAAVGEEVLFRGALQPVFGLWATGIFFALVHMQYTLTPASLIILVIGLGFGWVRQRQSTTAAILAHFVYNFVIQMIAIWAAGAAGL